MPFTSEFLAVVIEPNGVYRLTTPLIYRGRDDTFVVPTGFETDLASVPRLMTWLVPIAGVHDRAAIVHDYLCVALKKAWDGQQDSAYLTGVNARDTDGIFRRILRELGVPLVRRWLFWTGVRWGALATPARRHGWLRDAPAVLAISVPALLILAVPALAVGLTLLIDRIVERTR